jgi:hypothetical protein
LSGRKTARRIYPPPSIYPFSSPSLARHLLTGAEDRINESSASVEALSKAIDQGSDIDKVRLALDRVDNACESIKEWCKGVRPVDTINMGRRPLAHDQDKIFDEKIEAARYSDMAGTTPRLSL